MGDFFRDEYGNVYEKRSSGGEAFLVYIAVIIALILFLIYISVLAVLFSVGIMLIFSLICHGLSWFKNDTTRKNLAAKFMYLLVLFTIFISPLICYISIALFLPDNEHLVEQVKSSMSWLMFPLSFGLIPVFWGMREREGRPAKVPYLIGPAFQHQHEVLGETTYMVKEKLTAFKNGANRAWRIFGIIASIAYYLTLLCVTVIGWISIILTSLLSMWVIGLLLPLYICIFSIWYLIVGHGRKEDVEFCTCGSIHPFTGPGVYGWFKRRCRCGSLIEIWKAVCLVPNPIKPIRWMDQPWNIGARSMFIAGALFSLGGWCLIPNLEVIAPRPMEAVKENLSAAVPPKKRMSKKRTDKNHSNHSSQKPIQVESQNSSPIPDP